MNWNHPKYDPLRGALIFGALALLSLFVHACAPSWSPVGTGFEGLGDAPHPSAEQAAASEVEGHPPYILNLHVRDQFVRIYLDRWDRSNLICNALIASGGDVAKYRKEYDRSVKTGRVTLDTIGCAAFDPSGGIIRLPDGSTWDCVAFAPTYVVAQHELRHCVSRDEGHGAAFLSADVPDVRDPSIQQLIEE